MFPLILLLPNNSIHFVIVSYSVLYFPTACYIALHIMHNLLQFITFPVVSFTLTCFLDFTVVSQVLGVHTSIRFGSFQRTIEFIELYLTPSGSSCPPEVNIAAPGRRSQSIFRILISLLVSLLQIPGFRCSLLVISTRRDKKEPPETSPFLTLHHLQHNLCVKFTCWPCSKRKTDKYLFHLFTRIS